jgi:putative CocE/NonD family hydrolase
MRKVLALLLVLALAGCATPPDPVEPRKSFDPSVLSKAEYGILPAEEVWVQASDGVQLNNVLFRPDTDQSVPVFINFSPYWGDTAMQGGDAFAKYMVEEYVPRGYAVVLSAVRGTGHSAGCFQIGGDVEVRDAYEVIDHFAKQSWSNGHVAAGGKSYDSTTQNGVVAKMPHPALKGIFHVSGITDMYRYNAKDGVVYHNGLQFTPRYYATQAFDEYLGITNSAGSPRDESPASLLRLLDDLACPEFARHLASGQGTAGHGMRDAYWQERNWISHLPESTWNGSVFFVHGLQDWNVKPDHINPWVDILQEKGIPVLGWLHQDTENLGHVYPMRSDWNQTMLRWLDGTLKGIDVHLEGLWGYEVQGSDDVWRRSATWPPNVEWRLLSSEPAPAKTRIAGVPYALVTVVPSQSDQIARLALYDGSKWVGEAARRIALSDDLMSVRPITPGQPVTLNLTFFPLDHELEAGATFIVELGAPPMGVNTPPDFFYRPDQVSGVEYRDVQVFLPVASLDGEVRPQPKPIRCFAC